MLSGALRRAMWSKDLINLQMHRILLIAIVRSSLIYADGDWVSRNRNNRSCAHQGVGFLQARGQKTW